jgi:hypothetical protein
MKVTKLDEDTLMSIFGITTAILWTISVISVILIAWVLMH